MADSSFLGHKPVPKFASFRPKAQPSGNDRDVSDSKHDRLIHQDQSSRLHESRNVQHNRAKTLRHERSSREKHERHGTSQPPVAPWDDEPELFVVDKLGDESNLEYGSLPQYNVPSYLRSGSGGVCGLSPDHRIDREASNQKHVVVSDTRLSYHNRRDKAAFIKAHFGKETRIRPMTTLADWLHDLDASFLPLTEHKLNDRQCLENTDNGDLTSSTDDDEHHYRSIRGKAKPINVPNDRDLEFYDPLSPSEDYNRSLETNAVLAKKASLSKRVDSEPTNGDAWLDLIAHQDLLMEHQSEKRKVSIVEQLSTADIKLSMYEKALNAVRNPEYKERLLLGMMEEGAKVWDTRKLGSRWQNVLQENPLCQGLWAKYIDFEQTNFSTFRFDQLRETYTKCLRILREVEPADEGKVAEDNKVIEIQLYVLLRVTLFMREAGFPEQSVAIWQAIIEFNCCRPYLSSEKNACGRTREDLLKIFEEYWESEVPRVGEEGHQGWATHVLKPGQMPQPRSDKPLPQITSDSLIEDWYEYETAQFSQGRRPARTIDDTGEDDPYRVVLFSDVEAFLLYLTPTNQQTLIYAFLAYCHLPAPENTPSHLLEWWSDAFIRNDGLQGFGTILHSLRLSNINHNLEPESLRDAGNSLPPSTSIGSPISLYLSSVDVLFAKQGTWFSKFDEWLNACDTRQAPIEEIWVCRVLKVLVGAGIGGNDLAEYLLALEFKISPSNARKTAKTFLKKKPSELRLYNVYALMEYRLGNVVTAESVITTAINMSESLGSEAQKEAVTLWQTWVWELLESASSNEALMRLLMIADENVMKDAPKAKANPAAVLRTQRILINGRDHALSFGDYRHALLYAECLCLLEYLVNSLSIDAALVCFKSYTSLLGTHMSLASPHHELAHQARARLLYYHITHIRSFKPALVRATLLESIKLFPQNTMFLSLYALNESRFRIDDRVRSVVQDIVLCSHNVEGKRNTESIILYFFTVYVELTRSTIVGSNIHSVRAAFERAVGSLSGKASAAMWNLYFLFEHSNGELQKAKAVFYRAVRACPWVKELYLLPFKYLRDFVLMEELQGVYNMVVEKELRVFVSLDDAFERKAGT